MSLRLCLLSLGAFFWCVFVLRLIAHFCLRIDYFDVMPPCNVSSSMRIILFCFLVSGQAHLSGTFIHYHTSNHCTHSSVYYLLVSSF